MSGVKRIQENRDADTGSSHTVCQIPVLGVYQIKLDSSSQYCFPLAICSFFSQSSTSTRMHSSPQFRQWVTSKLKGVWPPEWVPTHCPLTHTRQK